MPRVDRNIIRLAVYEMLWHEDIPYRVSINEAIDIGKRFGAEDSGAFINGILDRIRLALENGEIDMPEAPVLETALSPPAPAAE
jgi:N utilization substance protein B